MEGEQLQPSVGQVWTYRNALGSETTAVITQIVDRPGPYGEFAVLQAPGSIIEVQVSTWPAFVATKDARYEQTITARASRASPAALAPT